MAATRRSLETFDPEDTLPADLEDAPLDGDRPVWVYDTLGDPADVSVDPDDPPA
ncbi:hypothetical protein KEM60_02233 [Austwickia sp. TVS 96-490-7B]|uniref:hypothetical protein n=1 Tax=Austwickia sp. TVS 96-490-7B TaxID=2830843 RepID=UPI001C56B9ED|nr:hypothetical protein [Austwickia sp. TVS 96-490-7B]MBW3086022.1 hypothetical protein [Austwickia sp. TVS 96-490-7B]